MSFASQPLGQRESYTQQVSLKIGISLEKKFNAIALQQNVHINNVFRDALVQYISSTETVQDNEQITMLTQRIKQLEFENTRLINSATPTLTPDEVAYTAFCNERIIAAIRDVAERVENGDIDFDAKAIINQFISFAPNVE